MKKYLKLILLIMIIFPVSVFAQGGVTVSSKQINIEVGQTATLNIVADNGAGKVNISRSGNSISYSSNVSELFLDSYGTKTITLTIKGNSVGQTKLAISIPDFATYDEEPLKFSFDVYVNVSAKKTNPPATTKTTTKQPVTVAPKASTTTTTTTSPVLATLDFTSLKVDEFSVVKDGNAYYVTVNKDTQKVNISATVPEGMKINGEVGERGLNDGKNTINYIIVEESTNRSAEYQLIITKPTASAVDTKLASLRIVDFDLNFNPSTFEYSLNVPSDTKELYIMAEGNNKDVTITGTGLINLDENNGVIKITSTYGEGNTTIYTININKTNPMLIFWVLIIVLGVLLVAAIIYIVLREMGKLEKGIFDSMQNKAQVNRNIKSNNVNAGVKIGGSSVVGVGTQVVAPTQVNNPPQQQVNIQSVESNVVPQEQPIVNTQVIKEIPVENKPQTNEPQIIQVSNPQRKTVQTVNVGQPVKVVTKQVVPTTVQTINTDNKQ